LKLDPDSGASSEDHAESSTPISSSTSRNVSVSETFAAVSRPLTQTPATIEDLERGVLDALRMGLADVARTLRDRLDARTRSTDNVVAFPARSTA